MSILHNFYDVVLLFTGAFKLYTSVSLVMQLHQLYQMLLVNQ